MASVEELECFPIDPMKVLLVGKELNLEDKQKLKSFLLKNLDIFAWRHEDMVGIYPKVSFYYLNTDLKFTPQKKKKKALKLKKRYKTLKEEVEKLLSKDSTWRPSM